MESIIIKIDRDWGKCESAAELQKLLTTNKTAIEGSFSKQGEITTFTYLKYFELFGSYLSGDKQSLKLMNAAGLNVTASTFSIGGLSGVLEELKKGPVLGVSIVDPSKTITPEPAESSLTNLAKSSLTALATAKGIALDTLEGKIISLLDSNYNIILNGAPGTGKTFIAKKIAESLSAKCAFVQFHPSYDYTDFVEGLRPVKGSSGSDVGFELKPGAFKAFCEQALKESETPHIMIIDEINRGEISKIFGELFYSIDPGYRGVSGAVRTQYANMVGEPNEFDALLGFSEPADCGHFFIPQNVYIIGTMNDIDRSVDSMDFAMRRRFAWKEIKAADTKDDIFSSITSLTADEITSLGAAMDALNEIISGKVADEKKGLRALLGEAYELGASYFKKIENYGGSFDDRADALWHNHLEVILREYLRGTQDPVGDLEKLKKTYFDAVKPTATE